MVVKKKSARQEHMGATLSRTSKGGRLLIERERRRGFVRGAGAATEFKDPDDEEWYSIRLADMCHHTDCVMWWNTTGRHTGSRSAEVRAWMSNPNNYYLGHRRYNRSAGAKIGKTHQYLPSAV